VAGNNREGQRCLREFRLRTTDLLNLDLHYETDLIEFAIERARFDLWIVTAVAIVTLQFL
jgi:hypothetical protein